MTRRSLACCALTSYLLMLGEPANAADDELSEVVVSATRRDASVLEVPLSVSAYSQAALDDLGIKDIADVSRITPGLTFTPGWVAATNIAIRGISSTIGTATTGLYIDDTPIQIRRLGSGGFSANIYPAVFDLERIEVLRGPQGTLFGAGSEGGTVRFISPQPGLERYSGYGRAQAAFTEKGDPSYEIGAAIGGPVVEDKVGFRLSAFTRRDGGWVDRVSYPSLESLDRNSNSEKTVVLRGALAFAIPDSGLTVTPALYYQDLDRDDLGQYWRSLSDPKDGVFRNGLPLAQEGSDHFTLPSLRIQWDLRAVSLFSNTSYFDRRNSALADYTAFIPELLGASFYVPEAPDFTAPTPYIMTQKAFTQELRLQSRDTGQRLLWVLGAFYQDMKETTQQRVFTPQLDDLTLALYGLTTEQAFGVPLQAAGLSYLALDAAHDRQTALFGQADFRLTPRLTLTAGLRAANAKFNFDNRQDGALNGGPSSSSGKQSEKPLTPKLGVSFRASEDWMLYSNAAKGFRIGGANPFISADRCGADLATIGLTEAPGGYDADKVWSYDVGAKGRIGGRLQLEASVFFIDWSDIQDFVYLPNCGLTFVRNVGKAQSKGFDLLATLRPLQGLTLSAAVAYTKAEFAQTILGAEQPGGGRALISAKGDPLGIAPWHLSFSGDYRFAPFGNGNEAYVRLNYDYDSGYTSGPDPEAVSYDPLDAYKESRRFAGLRIGVRRDKWDVAAFVDNLTNSTNVISVTHNVVSSALFRDVTYRPRTMGVTVTVRY